MLLKKSRPHGPHRHKFVVVFGREGRDVKTLVESGRSAWVAVNLPPELREYRQVRVVRCRMNIEVLHVVRRAVPPLIAAVRGVVRVADDRRFAVLGTRRAVEVETVEPRASAVEHLACVRLVLWLGGGGAMEVQIHRNAAGIRSDELTGYAGESKPTVSLRRDRSSCGHLPTCEQGRGTAPGGCTRVQPQRSCCRR